MNFKVKRFALFAAFTLYPLISFAASGAVSIDSVQPYPSGLITVSGTYIMTSDDGPTHYDLAGNNVCRQKKYQPTLYYSSSLDYGMLFYEIDGVYQGKIGDVSRVYRGSTPPLEELGEELKFSLSINSNEYELNERHELSVYLQDVYCYRKYVCAGWPYWSGCYAVFGNRIGSDAYTFGCDDADEDGHFRFNSACPQGNDCNDSDPSIHPGAIEACDKKDNDCDGEIDEGCCDLEIENFRGSDTTIDPASGQSIEISAAISEKSDKPVEWTLTVAGQRFQGNGYSVRVDWDGKYSDGKVIEPGTHEAFLSARTTDGTCRDGAKLEITVIRTADCKLKVSFGSSANVASGELTDTIRLFSTAGTGRTTDFSLRYASLDAHEGPLGLGWSHGYEIGLAEQPNGDVVLRLGDGSYKLYTPDGGGYVSQQGNHNSLTRNADDTFTFLHPDGTRDEFGPNDKIAAIVDRNGNAIRFEYAGDDLVSIRDADGRETLLVHNGDGRLTEVLDPAGNVYNFTLDNNALSEIGLPDGAVWGFVYEGEAFLIAKTDPGGNVTTYEYDDRFRVISATDPEGRHRTIAYPSENGTIRTTLVTEKDGSLWMYNYDTSRGVLLDKVDPEGNVTGNTYDTALNMTSKTAPERGTTSWTFDDGGNMTSVTDPGGRTTTFAYNAFGQITATTDPERKETAYTYDGRGNLTSVTDPSGAVTSYAYDGRGRPTGVTLATGQTTTLTYDEGGNVASLTGPDGSAWWFTYDAVGNRTAATDAEGNTTNYEYDAGGRLLKVIDASGKATAFTYDANGNRTGITDANGNRTHFEHNHRGQPVKMTDALGGVTEFAYGGSAGCSRCSGGADKLSALTDANGNATRFEYDPLGRLTGETDPLGNRTLYDYDAAGSLAARTDASDRTIAYAYDGLGRLLGKTYPDGSTTDFTYDGRGNLLTAANPHIAYRFAYDASDALISVTDDDGNAISYTYAAAGKRTGMVGPRGIAVDYRYDRAGRLSTIASKAGNFGFTYNDLGRRSSLRFPNGITTSYHYDGLGRLTDLVTADGANLIARNSYTHDAVGNRLSNATEHRTMSYTYDAIYRLTEATASSPGNSPDRGKGKQGKGVSKAAEDQKEFYAYDPVGNRLRTDKVGGYIHNAGNELLSADGAEYRYDANGNLTRKITDEGVTTYTWDAENRLIEVSMYDGTRVAFAYDPFGRRIEKTATSEDGIKTTRYIYDGEDVLIELDGSGETGNIYVHGPGIDEPLALIGDKGATYYHADGLGSIVAMTDDRARRVQEYEYDSFGNLHDMKNRVKQLYTYTGREHDRETGLYYYRARHYDPEIGRFIGKDPIAKLGNTYNNLKNISFSQHLSAASKPYTYTGNNPVIMVDPWGLSRLVFDRSNGTISLYDKNGNTVSSGSASNNATNPWANGSYEYSWYNPHPWSGPNDAYGSYGIFIFNVNGRSGMGVHAGRQDQCADGSEPGGHECPTAGCVRTNGATMQQIINLHQKDPLTTITIQD